VNMKQLQKLEDTGNWMVRFSNDGITYNGFQWKPIGEWTIAPDWDETPECGGGLHGQGPGGWGYCQPGKRFELVETDKIRVIIDGDKVKTPRAKIIAIDWDAWEKVLLLCDKSFPGSVDLRGYGHPLPEGLTSIGGFVDLEGYGHPLPEGLKQGVLL
jgi:hypothetical protein